MKKRRNSYATAILRDMEDARLNPKWAKMIIKMVKEGRKYEGGIE